MHYCGVIVKEKQVSVVDARNTLGKKLVEKGIADWFSTDDYRERLFDINNEAKQVISLKEFKKEFEDWDTTNDFVIIDRDLHIEGKFLTNKFSDFYGIDGWREFREKFAELHRKAVNSAIAELDEDKYDVCLLDYHN